MASIWIDDDDLTAYEWRVKSAAGLDDLPERNFPLVSLPVLGLSIEASTYANVSPRDFSIVFAIRTASQATLEAAIKALNYRLGGPAVVVRSTMRTNQQLTARAIGGKVSYGIGPQFVAPFYFQTEVPFRAANPYWKDTAAAAQSVSFGTTATALPQGTAPTRGTITIAASGGSVVNPKIRYRNSAGTLLAEILFTHTILTGDALEVNADTGTIRKRVSGVWSDAESLATAGFTLPTFAPRDGNYLTSTWPTIELAADSGAANGQGTAAYSRAWG